jgi:eukaryotic-like serine/threonine-protein kinase
VPVSTQGTLLAGRYRVLRHLGAGGMASVLLCRDERLDRQVAVKRLHADTPADVERRFVREAKLGASLNHPNLVSVYDTAVDDEGVLIVMEYVPGESLAAALRHGPLGPRRVARMARELGAALDHAHAHGVVHRDVKPANVLLRDDGVSKLVDLGIATAANTTRITRSGTVLGTAAYMAPEQLEGREPGPAVDVYALAAVCYETLAGRRPREGKTPVEIAHSIATSSPPDLRDHWPAASWAVAEVLRRGMAREPSARPSSAGQLGSELARALEEEPRTAATQRLPRRAAAPAPAADAAWPAPAPRPPRRVDDSIPIRDGNRHSRRYAVAGLLALLAIAVVAVVLLSGGDDGGGQTAQRSDGAQRQQQRERDQRERAARERAARERDRRAEEQQAQPTPAPAPEADEPAPVEPAPAPEPAPEEEQAPAEPPASGADLNAQGFELMNQGRYEEAIPVLQQAVEALEGSGDINFAYALYNLGRSLRLAGRPAEAIPVLEQRLQIPNQTDVVRRELESARREAGQG